MNNIWSPSRHIGGIHIRVLFTIAAVVISSAVATAQSSVIISEEFTWQSQSVAQTTCDTYKHTLAGPGVLTIRTKMSPFRVREFYSSSEDILTHGVGYFAESLGRTVNGMEGANTNEFIGKPIDRISRWKIDGNKHNVEFKVCNPVKCNLAGDCSQYQATASIVVDFAASTRATSELSATTDSTGTKVIGVIGVWVRTREGRVIDRMEIRASGDGYSVELRWGDNAPLYASAFGVLHGSRIVAATHNSSDGVSGLLVLSFKGDQVHWRSYYLDGRMSWDGDFTRRPLTSSTTDTTPAPTHSTSSGSGTLPEQIVGTWIVIENGKVVDRIDIAPYGDGYKVEARASDSAPTYWNGFGVHQGDRLFIATRNVSNGVSGFVVMTFKGDRVHYRSYYLDGRQAWDSDFTRRP